MATFRDFLTAHRAEVDALIAEARPPVECEAMRAQPSGRALGAHARQHQRAMRAHCMSMRAMRAQGNKANVQPNPARHEAQLAPELSKHPTGRRIAQRAGFGRRCPIRAACAVLGGVNSAPEHAVPQAGAEVNSGTAAHRCRVPPGVPPVKGEP